MLGGFLPPVVFEVTANATQALASFKGINTQLKAMEAQALKTGKALTSMNKAAMVGTKVLKSFAVAFGLFAAIGVKEIMALEKSFVRLGQALANVGVSTEANRKSIGALVDSYEQLGFGSDKTADAYAVLITATGNVEKSNRLLAISADLARYKQMSLDEAARTLAKATQGSAKAFKEFGITLDTNKSKSVAAEEAIDKLAQRVGGQATAYSKTFAGQLAILNENVGNLAEQIGMRLLPFLNKLVSGLNNTGTWIKKNNDFVIALAAAITIALIPAVVNLTKKLALLATTILKSPIARLAILVFAVAYAFVKLYNATDNNRKMFAKFAQVVVDLSKFMVDALENVWWVVAEALPLAFANFLKWVGKVVPKFKQMGEELEKSIKSTGPAKAFQKAKDELLEMSVALEKIKQGGGKPLELKWNFKVPEIPGFSGDGGDFGDAIVSETDKALDRATQRFKDFARDIADVFKQITASYKSIVTKDFDKLISERIGDPVDKLIYDAQAAITRYESASGAWTSANKALTKSQNDYVKALKTGEDSLIAAAESALGYAENAVGGLADDMATALEDIERLQEDMINAVVDMYEKISELETERTKILKEAQKERTELEKDYNKEIARLRKDYDSSVLIAEAEAAKRRAEIVKTSVDQLRSAFRTATYRTLGDVYSSLTFEGRYLKGGSMEKILKTLGLQSEKAQSLADNAAKLAGLGFSQTFIEEVIALGPDMGNSLSQTILNSTPASITQLQEYWKKLETTSLHGVDGIAQQLNSGMTLATEELTAQLLQVDIDLKNQLAEAQVALTNSLTEAFENYSSALDEINNRTAEQITAIDNQITLLNAKIGMMREALSKLSGLATPGTSGTTNIIPRAETTEEEGPASSCESGKGVFKVITYNGQEMSRTLVRCIPKATTDTPVVPVVPEPVEEDPNKGKYYNYYTGEWVSDPSLIKPRSYIPPTSIVSTGTILSGREDDTPNETAARQRIADIFAKAGQSVTVNVTANTNASSQAIANDVGWAIRTSGDVQYRTSTGRVLE